MKEIKSGAFRNLSNLEEIEIPDSVNIIDSTNLFTDCKSLKKVIIRGNLNRLGKEAFQGCEKLQEIVLPYCLEEIGMWAFAGCKSLYSVIIPKSVTVIREYAFIGCKALVSVYFPDSVTKVEFAAFGGCDSLEDFHLKHPTPSITFEKGTFATPRYSRIKPSLITLYVPKGSENIYRQHPYFNQYRNIIGE